MAEETEKNHKAPEQETASATEQKQAAEQQADKKEKTAEELALEEGYYACCFRTH